MIRIKVTFKKIEIFVSAIYDQKELVLKIKRGPKQKNQLCTGPTRIINDSIIFDLDFPVVSTLFVSKRNPKQFLAKNASIHLGRRTGPESVDEIGKITIDFGKLCQSYLIDNTPNSQGQYFIRNKLSNDSPIGIELHTSLISSKQITTPNNQFLFNSPNAQKIDFHESITTPNFSSNRQISEKVKILPVPKSQCPNPSHSPQLPPGICKFWEHGESKSETYYTEPEIQNLINQFDTDILNNEMINNILNDTTNMSFPNIMEPYPTINNDMFIHGGLNKK